MLIKTLTGSLAYEDVQIETSTQSIGIVITGTDETAATILATTVEVNLVKPSGQETLRYRRDLKRIFEDNSHQEGIYRAKVAYGSGMMSIGVDGALNLGDRGYLSLNITVLDADLVVKVYALDGAKESDLVWKYKPVQIQDAVSAKEVGLVSADAMLIPIAKVDNIQLDFANGKSVKYTQNELYLIADDINDITSVNNSPTGAITSLQCGSELYLRLQVTECLRAIVVPASSSGDFEIDVISAVDIDSL